MTNALRRLPIRRSLIRPFLLAGGERAFVMTNVTLIAALLLGVGINSFTLIVAGLLATVGQWGLVQAAKADAQMSQVYLRHIHYRDFYSAESSVHAKPLIVKSTFKNES